MAQPWRSSEDSSLPSSGFNVDTEPREKQAWEVDGSVHKLVKSKKRKALEPFVEYVLDAYYNGVDKYGNQIEESSREESFEHRWNKARAILLKSK